MDHRRKWDRDEYAKIALSRFDSLPGENDEENIKMPLDFVKPRDYKIDFSSFTSRKQIISTTLLSKSYASGGFHCSLCDIIVKNSTSFLDHVNSRRHQKHLGMSLKVRRSSVEEVRWRLRCGKKYPEEEKTDALKLSLREVEEESQKMEDLEESRKKKKKRILEEPERELPSELMEVMGFSNFVMNKKK